MPRTYDRAPQDVLDLIMSVMQESHQVLVACDVTVDCLVVADGTGEPCLKHRGWPAAATIRIVPQDQRALGQCDARMVIDHVTWSELAEPARRALVDHELEHLMVRGDPSGEAAIGQDGRLSPPPQVDDSARPKLKIRPHDWELSGFRSIVQRHGTASPEVQSVRACRDDTGQYYWDWSGGGRPSYKIAIAAAPKQISDCKA